MSAGLLFLRVLMASQAPAAEATLYEEVAVESLDFHQDSPTGFIFCRGLVIGHNAFTARHCVRNAQSTLDGSKRVFISYGARTIELDRARFSQMTSANFSAQSASKNTDFNVFSLPGFGLPRPLSKLPMLAAPAFEGQSIILGGGDRVSASCRIASICGSSFTYRCDRMPVPTWSGSPIWSKTEPRRLLGIHLGEGSNGYSKAASALTIIGRSSSLFETSEEFSDTVARSSAYVHKWSSTCAGQNPSLTSSTKLRAHLIESPSGMIHGLSATEDSRLLAATITGNLSICIFDRARETWTCAPNPAPAKDRVNAIVRWKDVFAIAESRWQGNQITNVMAKEARTGGISLVTVSSGPPLRVDVTKRISSPVGSIFALALVGGDLVAGGEDGVCVVGAAAAECGRLCRRPDCQGEAWRVNGLTAVSDDAFLAAGFDHYNGAIKPSFRLFERRLDGWRERWGLTEPYLDAAVGALMTRRTGMQLKAPVVMADGTQLIFGSDGAAYQVSRAAIVGRVPIKEKLCSTSGEDQRDSIEDAIRDAIALPDNWLAVASSDGTIRFLKLDIELGRPVLRASRDWTVFDRGIWITELEQVGAIMFARAQDGSLTEIDFSGLFDPQIDLGAACVMAH